MMGANIMTKTGPALAAITEGFKETLPAFIKFKGKQAEAERARDMAVAKIAVETKLSRETDNLRLVRAIEKEQRSETSSERKAARSEAAQIRKENRETNTYMVLKPAKVPLSAVGVDAPEGQMFTIPALTTFSLNKAAAQRLSDLGVSIATGIKYNYEDVVEANTAISPLSDMNYKQVNALTENKVLTAFKSGQSSGTTVNYRTPREWGIHTGLATTDTMQPGSWKKLYDGYRGYMNPLVTLYGRFDTLKKYVNADGSLNDEGKGGLAGFKAGGGGITGFSSVIGRLGDRLKGIGIPAFEALGKELLGGEKQSTMSLFEAEARIVLAQIAPLYLGESGKTISDNDRIRVALALGFEIDKELATGKNPILSITGFNSNFFANPHAINNALNVTQGIVKKYMDQGNNEMQGYLHQFSRLLETQPKELQQRVTPGKRLIFNATLPQKT
jgi:hypothetical protein